MTGNVVLLAFGAAGAQGLPVLAPTVSLVVFLVGAAAGGRLASNLVGPAGAEVPAPQRRRWVTVVLLAELGLVVAAGVAAVGLPVDAGGARRYVVIGLLAAGLGLQNATVRRLAPNPTAPASSTCLTGNTPTPTCSWPTPCPERAARRWPSTPQQPRSPTAVHGGAAGRTRPPGPPARPGAPEPWPRAGPGHRPPPAGRLGPERVAALADRARVRFHAAA